MFEEVIRRLLERGRGLAVRVQAPVCGLGYIIQSTDVEGGEWVSRGEGKTLSDAAYNAVDRRWW